MVTVRLFAAARAAAGHDRVDAISGTLAEVLADLTERYPGLGPVLPRCSYLLDAVAVHGDHRKITLDDGSALDILPPFAGG